MTDSQPGLEIRHLRQRPISYNLRQRGVKTLSQVSVVERASAATSSRQPGIECLSTVPRVESFAWHLSHIYFGETLKILLEVDPPTRLFFTAGR